jgi:hypothetical protein
MLLGTKHAAKINRCIDRKQYNDLISDKRLWGT